MTNAAHLNLIDTTTVRPTRKNLVIGDTYISFRMTQHSSGWIQTHQGSVSATKARYPRRAR